MRKFFALLFYFLGVLVAVYMFFNVNHLLNVAPKQLIVIIKIFAVFYVLALTLFLIWLFKLSKQEPKTEVKIIYKTIDKQKEAEEKKKKEQKLLEKYLSEATKDLENISDPEKFGEKLLSNFAKTFDIVQGLFFLWHPKKQVYFTSGSFAYYSEETYKEFKLGEGITGQVAKNKKFLYIDNVPENYIIVFSGLGSSSPRYLTFLPILDENDEFTLAVVEFANFSALPQPTEKIFTEIAKRISPLVKKLIDKLELNEQKEKQS